MHHYLKNKTLFEARIKVLPASDLGMIIVIPAYHETEVIRTLQAIKKCELPEASVEVLIVFNDSESDAVAVKKVNAEASAEACKWAEAQNETKLRFFPVYFADLPAKHAGVGLARKIGMDEGCFRFEKVGQKQGILVGFDADSLCRSNYLVALEGHFRRNPHTSACSIHFEHPLCGTEFDDEVYTAIALYELHLRYYIQAQRYIGFPYAYQTIGSSMAVRSQDYMQQGGMNRRKAGEDFYFLHKFTHLDNFSELNRTTVIPSPRISDRVPFGTGKAVGDLLQRPSLELNTYAPESFIALVPFFSRVSDFFSISRKGWEDFFGNELSLPLSEFLLKIDAFNKICEIRSNTATADAFRKRFFRWFNAFQLMKYLHYVRDHHYPDVPVVEAAQWLLQHLPGNKTGPMRNAKELLKVFRNLVLHPPIETQKTIQ